MGSLDAPGIPVVPKTNLSFRKFDIKIQTVDSPTDTVSILTSNRPEVARPLGSGCVVKDTPGGAVADCTETVVFGLYREARSTSERIASAVGAPKDLSVATSGNMTIPVIEDSLAPDLPQTSVKSLGTHIVRRNSVTDGLIDRVDSPGFNDELPH